MLLIDKSIDLNEINQEKREEMKEYIESEKLYIMYKKNGITIYGFNKKFDIAKLETKRCIR